MSLDLKVKLAQRPTEFHIGQDDEGGQGESELSEVFERAWVAAAPPELYALSDEEDEDGEQQASVTNQACTNVDAELDVLESLVELADVGEAVSWPPGSSESSTREAMRERPPSATPPKRARIAVSPEHESISGFHTC